MSARPGACPARRPGSRSSPSSVEGHLSKSRPFPDLYRRRPRLLVPGAYRHAPLNNLNVILIRFTDLCRRRGSSRHISYGSALGGPPARASHPARVFRTYGRPKPTTELSQIAVPGLWSGKSGRLEMIPDQAHQANAKTILAMVRNGDLSPQQAEEWRPATNYLPSLVSRIRKGATL